MYLLDDRYATAVSFIEGFDVALERQPLRGFKPWLADRICGGESPIHWAYIIASVRLPNILDGRLRLDHIPSEYDRPLIEDLLRFLNEFISSSA